MKYVEERSFTIRIELRCEFPDDYDGEEDGYAWVDGVRPVTAEILQAAATAIRRRPGWSLRAGNRGRPSDEEILLIAERVIESGNKPEK